MAFMMIIMTVTIAVISNYLVSVQLNNLLKTSYHLRSDISGTLVFNYDDLSEAERIFISAVINNSSGDIVMVNQVVNHLA